MKKNIYKECKKHGLARYILEGRGYYRCTKCRSEDVTKKRRKTKAKLVEMFGGKCVVCGYSRYVGAMDFHHKNPDEKEFGLGNSGITRAFSKMLKEAEKCVLVCKNCHSEIEAGIINSPVV